MTETFDEAIEQYSAEDDLEKEIAKEVATPSDDDIITSHLNSIREQNPGATDDAATQPESPDTFVNDASAESFDAPKKHTARNIILIIVGILILIAAGLTFWVYSIEKNAEGVVPAGVSFANEQTLAGMKEPEVKTTLENAAKQLLENSVVVTLSETASDSFEANTVSKPLSNFVTINTSKMAEDALDVRQDAPLITRLQVDILKKTIDKNIPLIYTIDEDAIASFATEIAKASNQDAKNAELKQSGGKIDIVDGQFGYKTNKKALKKDIVAAIEDSLKSNAATDSLNVALTGKTIEPKKTAESLQTTPSLVVTLSERSIVLFNGNKVVKSYQCAIGTPDHPTPVGNWKIVLKRNNPTWVNPGSEWAKDMPKAIPPGPTNPLGLRALNLNASGIRIHGTTSLSSIGTAASHGCMRMRNDDIIDLFDRVEVGTPVFIIP